MPTKRFIIIHPKDNVATAIAELARGETVNLDEPPAGRKVTMSEAIPYGHKFAVRPITSGEEILKYGECIGRACRDIGAGAHVHVHNVESLRGRGDLT